MKVNSTVPRVMRVAWAGEGAGVGLAMDIGFERLSDNVE